MNYFHEDLIKMKCLNQDIRHEIDERSKELTSIVRKATELDDKYLNKFFLVAIYANWEAFVKNLIGYYIDYLYNYNILKNLHFVSLIIKHEKLFERNLTDINQIKDILKKIAQIKTNPYLNLDKIKFNNEF